MKGNSVQQEEPELQRVGCPTGQGQPRVQRGLVLPRCPPRTRLWALGCGHPWKSTHHEAVIPVLLLNVSCSARKINVKGSVCGHATRQVGRGSNRVWATDDEITRLTRVPAHAMVAGTAGHPALPHGGIHADLGLGPSAAPPTPEAPTSVPPMVREPGCFRGVCWLPFERFLL